MSWEDILKFKATEINRQKFYQNNPQFNDDWTKEKIREAAEEWNKYDDEKVRIDFYNALQSELDEGSNLDEALKEIKSFYKSWARHGGKKYVDEDDELSYGARMMQRRFDNMEDEK